jgi:hypothetical protein
MAVAVMKLFLLAVSLAFAGCTFVYVRGDDNDFEDVGGHGGGLTLPTRQQNPSGPLQRLNPSH